MLKASYKDTCKRNEREFKAKKQGLLRCEGYLYRKKISVKLNKVLDSLKKRAF